MKESIQKKSKRGGARAGAGRPPGTRERVTVQSLLIALDYRSGGQGYEDLLMEDFLRARAENDKHLTLKTHTLISNKLVSSLNAIEITDSADTIALKQQAFAEAIRQITGIPAKD